MHILRASYEALKKSKVKTLYTLLNCKVIPFTPWHFIALLLYYIKAMKCAQAETLVLYHFSALKWLARAEVCPGGYIHTYIYIGAEAGATM